ncbi:MAG: hypothetical protein P8X88_06030 [Gammaproteobacteria bacterium]
MKNNLTLANKWLDFLCDLELPDITIFKKHILAGEITGLCDCGCHSFEFTIPHDVEVEPITQGNGLFLEVAFNTNKEDVMDFLVFTDDRGYLSGVDITYGFEKHTPLPEGLAIRECVHMQID